MFAASALMAQQQVPDSYINLVRSDIKTQKTEIVTEVLSLNDEQGAKFWPLQREYEAELSKLGDERLKLIKEYAASWGALTDKQAEDMGHRALDLESRRTALMKKYFDKIAKAVSPTVAAKYFQIENQMLTILDLQVASELPLIK